MIRAATEGFIFWPTVTWGSLGWPVFGNSKGNASEVSEEGKLPGGTAAPGPARSRAGCAV